MRFCTLLIFASTTALLIAGAAMADSNSDRSVRIAGAVYLGDLATHVADARGLFAAHGLAAAVEYNDSGKQNMARLRAGAVDFALMALTPLVLDRFADADPGQADDPVILANLLQSYELTQIVVVDDSGALRPGELRDRRVAVAQGTGAEFVWWLFEQFRGLEHSMVETVSIPFPDTAEALISGRVTAAVLPEPWASLLEARFKRSGARRLSRLDMRSLYSDRWVIVTTRRYARQHPELCRDVLAAYRQATEFIERAPADAISIYEAAAGATDGILAERWESLDYDISLDWALIAGLQEQFRWAVAAGYETLAGPLRVLDLIDPDPLRDVRPGAVHIPVAVQPTAQP